MTATVTAVEQDDAWPPRAAVSVTGLATGSTVSLYRSVSGTRTLVRGAREVTMANTALVRVDAELPFGVPVRYVAVINGVTEVTSDATTYTLTGGKVAVTDAITGLAAQVVVVSWPTKENRRVSSSFVAGGRNVVVSGPRPGFEATIEILTETDSAREQFAALLAGATGNTLQIRQQGGYGGVDCYVSVVSDTERRYSGDGSDQRRFWELDVVETDPWPDTFEDRSAWTYDQLAVVYASLKYSDIAADYATYLALAQGILAAPGGGGQAGGGGGTTGFNGDGVKLVAPTASVSGQDVTLSSLVEWDRAIDFKYRQIAVRPPAGSGGTGFSVGYAPEAEAGAGTQTVSGTGTCDVNGAWTAFATYSLVASPASTDWTDGPSVTFPIGDLAATLFTDPFTGSDGAAWSANWTAGEVRTGATATILGNQGRLLSGTGTGWTGRISMKAAGTMPADVEVATTFAYNATESYLWLTLRGDTGAVGADGYVLQLFRGGTIGIRKLVGYAETALGTASFTFADSTLYKVRFQAIGSALKVKVWAASGSEPGSWTLEITDGTITAAGTVSVACGGGDLANGVVFIDDASVIDLTGSGTPGGGGGGGGAGVVLLGASGDFTANGSLAAAVASHNVAIAGTWGDNNIANHLEQYDIGPGGKYANWDKPIDLAVGGVFKTQGQSWAAAAAGSYDSQWTQCLNNIDSKWGTRSNGHLYIRFCHEFNGSFIPYWAVYSGEVANYITAFRRWVGLQRSILPGSHVVWPLNDGTSVGYDIRTAWPGDSYVDLVGIDTYNQYPFVTTQSQWNAKIVSTDQYGAPIGCEAWRQWAASHGKPLCVPEWSNNGDPSGAGGGGESPFYVQAMHDWAVANAGDGAGQVAYMVLFNLWNQYQMHPSTIQPLTAARYKAIF